MKIVCYDDAGRPAIGVRFEDGVLPTGYSDLRTFVEAGPRELDRLRAESQNPGRLVHPARFRAPLSPRSALLLAGGNYADHLAEAGLHPKEPVFFAKLRSAVIGPGEAIRIPTRKLTRTGRPNCPSSSASPPTGCQPSGPANTSSGTR